MIEVISTHQFYKLWVVIEQISSYSQWGAGTLWKEAGYRQTTVRWLESWIRLEGGGHRQNSAKFTSKGVFIKLSLVFLAGIWACGYGCVCCNKNKETISTQPAI